MRSRTPALPIFSSAEDTKSTAYLNWKQRYACLFRSEDGEAWRVVKAYTISFFPIGTEVMYRTGARHFYAKVISRAEYETFKVFEGEGK